MLLPSFVPTFQLLEVAPSSSWWTARAILSARLVRTFLLLARPLNSEQHLPLQAAPVAVRRPCSFHSSAIRRQQSIASSSAGHGHDMPRSHRLRASERAVPCAGITAFRL